MHRHHLVGNQYFVPLLVFYIESVMLGPPFIPESIYYTQSIKLILRFIPESMFYTQSVVQSPCFILTDRRNLKRNMARFSLVLENPTKEENKWIFSRCMGAINEKHVVMHAPHRRASDFLITKNTVLCY